MLTVALLVLFTLLCMLLSADRAWDNVTKPERNALVFDGRNRNYGAFVLRREYDRRFMLAFAGAIGLFAAAVALPKVMAGLGAFSHAGPIVPPKTGIDVKLDEIFNVPKPPEPNRPVESRPIAPPIPSPKPDPDVPVEATDSLMKPVPKDSTASSGPVGPVPVPGPPGGGPAPGGSPGGGGSELGTVDRPLTEGELDKVPRFPGGYAAMVRFIQDNIRFPEDMDGSRQKEWVEFVVDVDGSVVRVRSKGRARKAFSEAAERVVHIMPKWEAGELKDGTKAACLLILPIDFQTR